MNSPTHIPDTPEIAQHRRAIKAKPRDARSHALLGVDLLRVRRLDEGVAALKKALALDASLGALYGVLAPALHDLGQRKEAIDCYRRAIRLQAGDADLHKGLADVLRHDGQFEPAIASAARAAALAPEHVDIRLSLAAALHADGRYLEAADAFRQVLTLAPEHLDARMDLGRTLARLAHNEDAAACFEEVLAREPRQMEAHLGLGLCLRQLGRKEQAAEVYRRALAHQPDNGHVMAELGICQQEMGLLDEARITLERSMELAEPDANALRAAGYCQFELGHWEAARKNWSRAMELEPNPTTHSTLLFLLSHSLSDGAALTAAHRDFGARWETPLLAERKPHSNTRDAQRTIRVGFVSPDLHNHAVAQFISPVFGLLKDSTHLSLYVYYNNIKDDDTTAMLRGFVPNWRSIHDLDDAAAEALIRADGIDILIDLAGHSASNRLPLFARKPAPVQASWIGYAGTTGLQAVDYYLADQFYLPEGRYDDQFTEKIVRMPLIAPFMPHGAAPPVSPLPALANGHITFGSFHRANKISREVVALWSKLLHAVPDAKMLLGGLNGNEASMLGWFEELGIARERLILRERTSMTKYLAQHDDVDVCLSPFPYTGATTVCHALWMGVPTLTTIGPTNPSHAALGYLAHLGLSSFLADDEATFINLGTFLSQNLTTLAALRAGMRERFVSSVVGYPGVVAAGLEVTLRKMWVQWCEGKEPQAIRVRLSELSNEADAQPAA
jgi:predicted O-linked N-acetylglucosamine transferase (SPINDLY family)